MLNIIVACTDKENVIGKDNKLPWNLPEDLQHFKEITMGKTIVMGRKTFESLPGVLPNRKHLVITRDKNFTVNNKNVQVIHTVDEVINNFINNPETAFIIGGGQIYEQLIHSVDKIYLTKVLEDFQGDTTFPQINHDEFNIDYESEIFTSEKSGLKYQFVNLIKK